MKPAFTIVVPTHDHADTLWFSIQSVLQQTRQDFEIFIVGDGVPDRTRDIAGALMQHDPRISFFDNPKGQRHGEGYRHKALMQASGRFVCYQADDDLWLPNHLEIMASGLVHHDLVHSMRMAVSLDGYVGSSLFDASVSPFEVNRMRRSEAGFGLCSGAHTLEAYQRLPVGWHPAPAGISTDLYFWLQFLDQPWCRYQSIKWPTCVHFSSVTRKDIDTCARIAELARWWPRVLDVASRNMMHREVRNSLGEGVRLQDELAELELSTQREAELTIERDTLRAEIAALRHSRSWKVTVPLRLLLRRLSGR